jgi:hypothetical protein
MQEAHTKVLIDVAASLTGERPRAEKLGSNSANRTAIEISHNRMQPS